MTERGRASLQRSPTRLSVGPSALSLTGDRLVIDINEWTVPVPKRLRGRVTVDLGPRFDTAFEIDRQQRHFWQPLAPLATASVDFDQPGLGWKGRAYVDMNRGSEPLEKGFRRWSWSRAEAGEATTILYDAEPRLGDRRTLALGYHRDGSITMTEAAPCQPLPRTGWMVSRDTRAEPARPARILRTLEDTPFYSRSLIAQGRPSSETRAVHESVDLDRFRSRWVQVMLPFKMPRRTF
jgi:carotenoid 1,2-hydratase